MSQAERDSTAEYPISDATVRAIRRAILAWGKLNYKKFPWRTPERQWHGLIAEVLLQRTKAQSVVRIYDRFIAAYPEPEDLGTARVAEIEELIYPLGLKWRAPLLKELGQNISHGELSPATLQNLPGVGPYAAAAFSSFHLGKRAVLVDSNIVRWICRLMGRPFDGETRRKKWLIDMADRLTPKKGHTDYNFAVLDFTMNVCTKEPKCTTCILTKYCRTGLQNEHK